MSLKIDRDHLVVGLNGEKDGLKRLHIEMILANVKIQSYKVYDRHKKEGQVNPGIFPHWVQE